jgi:hypothetical protein
LALSCPQVFDEVSAGNASYAAQRWDDEKAAATKAAESLVERAIEEAVKKVRIGNRVE